MSKEISKKNLALDERILKVSAKGTFQTAQQLARELRHKDAKAVGRRLAYLAAKKQLKRNKISRGPMVAYAGV